MCRCVERDQTESDDPVKIPFFILHIRSRLLFESDMRSIPWHILLRRHARTRLMSRFKTQSCAQRTKGTYDAATTCVLNVSTSLTAGSILGTLGARVLVWAKHQQKRLYEAREKVYIQINNTISHKADKDITL